VGRVSPLILEMYSVNLVCHVKKSIFYTGKLASATRIMPTQLGKKGRFSPPKRFHPISVLVKPYLFWMMYSQRHHLIKHTYIITQKVLSDF
jgi:hypothetical protein